MARRFRIKSARVAAKPAADRPRADWTVLNRDAIAAFNEHVERNGSFGDDYRTF